MAKRNTALLEKIVQLYESGLNRGQIRDILGLTEMSIRSYFERYHIPGHGQPLPRRGSQGGARDGAWKGGIRLAEDGYIKVRCPAHPNVVVSNGYMLEHRLVMEVHLDRLLTPKEVVHHRNRNKLDNRIENLELFGTNAEHLKTELTGNCPNWSEEGLRRLNLPKYVLRELEPMRTIYPNYHLDWSEVDGHQYTPYQLHPFLPQNTSLLVEDFSMDDLLRGTLHLSALYRPEIH